MSMIVYEDEKSGELVVWTDCLDAQSFVTDLAAAIPEAIGAGDGAAKTLSLLQNATPILFKLSGYKAENVNEERVLWCGKVNPERCKVVTRVGR